MHQGKLTGSREKYHPASEVHSEIFLKVVCLHFPAILFSFNWLLFLETPAQFIIIFHCKNRWSIASHCSHCPARGNLATIVFVRQPDTRSCNVLKNHVHLKTNSLDQLLLRDSLLWDRLIRLLQSFTGMTLWPNRPNSHVHEDWCPLIHILLSILLTPL